MSDDTALSTREKTIEILLNSSVIFAAGACCYWVNKTCLNFALSIFDDIVETIETPTEKKEQEQKTE